jgi:hypothetical protein
MGLFGSKDKNSNAGAAPAPPAPPAPGAVAEKKEISEPKSEVKNLSAPPMPGGNLEDIKNQVASKPELPVEESINEPGTPVSADAPAPEEDPNLDDSLFDFSELDLESPTMDDNLESGTNPASHQEDSKDEDVSHSSKFINNDLHSHKISSNESYFVTTKQFKQLLEIIENVKNKVKEASETHLKLLDIKSEEDIEYENLRKDFQYVEDRLHEVDSIIFDN